CTPVFNNDWADKTFKQTEINWGYPVNWTEETDRKKVLKEVTKPSSNYKSEKNYDSQKDNRPKIYKVAIPGGSQHHLGLAIDVNDLRNKNLNRKFCDKKCESLLNKYGWFRTVRYDPYHFTYLGFTNEDDLLNRGLKKVRCKDYTDKNQIEYWVPDV